MNASDRAFGVLHRSGRSIGDPAFARPQGVASCVYGRNGEDVIPAEGRTRDKAWADALWQARGVGMLVD